MAPGLFSSLGDELGSFPGRDEDLSAVRLDEPPWLDRGVVLDLQEGLVGSLWVATVLYDELGQVVVAIGRFLADAFCPDIEL